MTLFDGFEAIVLGIVEGLTEFIPVSSTGHLLLLEHFLGFSSPGQTFEVLIQLGAILAILAVYAGKLWRIATALPSDPEARRFVLGVLVAFLPAMLFGALLHGFIKTTLFNPHVVCYALIAGGFVLLAVDSMAFEHRFKNPYVFPLPVCLKIGLFQCLAMVPGVSRSGATIVGAMLMGAEKRAAAEFSFFLAIPTMAGAFAFDLIKNRGSLNADDALLIGLGFVSAFVVGFIVVRRLLDFVSRRGLAVFGWWRILVGCLGLAGLLVYG
jgi:undecaprenyl-diphosphatase